VTGFVLTRSAERDLEGIEAHIARDNPAAAQRMVQRLRDTCRRIGEFPRIGRERRELVPGLFGFPAGAYLVFYRIGDPVVIVRCCMARGTSTRIYFANCLEKSGKSGG